MEQVQTIRSTPIGRSTRPMQISFGFLGLAGLVALIPFVPFVERVLLVATMAGAFVGYLMFRSRRKELDWFEIFIPYCAFFIVSYGFGAIYYGYRPSGLFRPTLQAYLTPALAVAAVGFASFLTGYAWRGGGTVRRSRLADLAPRGLGPAAIFAMLGSLGHFAAALTNRAIPLPFVPAGLLSGALQLSPLFLLGWYLAWHAFWSPRRFGLKDRAIFAALCVIASGILAMHVGTKEIVILVASIPGVAYTSVRKRLPLRAFLVVLLVVVFVVFPIYNTFRYVGVGLDTTERLRFTMYTASKWDATTYSEHTIHAFLGRVAYVTSAAAVIRDTGRFVDYRWGETLLLAPVSVFIPRFVWPDKPSIVIGREFGETFHLVHAADAATKIGASSIGELYWNFGLAGVIVGMFVVGIAFRWIYRRYGEPSGRDEPLRRALYVTLLAQSWNIEGGIAATSAGMVKFLVLVACLIAVLRRFGWIFRNSRPPAGGRG